MPKVILGEWTAKDQQLSRNLKSCLVRSGKKEKDVARKAGNTLATIYNHYRNPEYITIRELRAFIQVADVPKEDILDALYS